MKAFRQSNCVKWLGLFTLAMQFVLSFGHHHGHLSGRPCGATNAIADGQTAKGLSSITQSCSPADSDDDEDHCAICWTIAIAGTASLPVLEIIATPALAGIPLEPAKDVALKFSSPTASFQARAPPGGPIA